MQGSTNSTEARSEFEPIIGIDRQKLGLTLRHFLSGFGILALYVALCGLAFLMLALLVWGFRSILPALPGDVVPWLAGALVLALGATTWGLSFVAATQLLDETGVELRTGLTWLILPIAPVVMPVLVCFHIVGHIAADAWRPLRLAGYVVAVLLLLGALVSLGYVALR